MLTQAAHPPKPVRGPTGFSPVSVGTASSPNIHKGAYNVNSMRINKAYNTVVKPITEKKKRLE